MPCLLEGSCGTLALERMFATLASVWFEEGGDGSTLLLRGDVAVLAEPARLAKVEAALDAALAVRRDERRPEAPLLLQHDLWERFDAVNAAREGAPEPGPKVALTHLQQRLGRAIRELALPASEIRAVRPNLEQVAQAHAELADLGRASAWLEVTAHHRMGSGPESILPLHAATRASEALSGRSCTLARTPPGSRRCAPCSRAVPRLSSSRRGPASRSSSRLWP